MENAAFQQVTLYVFVEVNVILCVLMEEEIVILDVLEVAEAVVKKFSFLGVETGSIFFEWVVSTVFEKRNACEVMEICAFEETEIGVVWEVEQEKDCAFFGQEVELDSSSFCF